MLYCRGMLPLLIPHRHAVSGITNKDDTGCVSAINGDDSDGLQTGITLAGCTPAVNHQRPFTLACSMEAAAPAQRLAIVSVIKPVRPGPVKWRRRCTYVETDPAPGSPELESYRYLMELLKSSCATSTETATRSAVSSYAYRAQWGAASGSVLLV